MHLSQLTFVLADAIQYGLGDPDISVITADSRQVRSGALFVAVGGVNVDGHHYIGQALRQGAVAIVGERPPEELDAAPKKVFSPLGSMTQRSTSVAVSQVRTTLISFGGTLA